jgi:hypothetical protein
MFVVTLTPGSGICSLIIGIIGALVYLQKRQKFEILYINLNKASAPVNVFITCFLDLEKLNSKIEIINKDISVVFNKKINNYQVITEGYYELWHTSETQTMNSEIDLWYDEYENFFRLKQHIVESIHKSCASYLHYDVCLNIRRGDKITLEPHCLQGTVEEYIGELLKLNPKNVFHTSDDYSTLVEFRDKCSEINFDSFCSEVDKGFFLKDMNDNYTSHELITHVNKFLSELNMMKQIQWFIGTTTTNVGQVVKLARRNKNIIYIY